MKKRSLLLNLFVTFFKIGLFTFGGGYAMIALLENEFVENKKWIDKDEFLDMAAIAESTPGPIAVNAATYLGYKLAGFSGALFSTLAICIPSFVIIFVISSFFENFIAVRWVSYAFKGIQVCVVYLILSAGIRMFRKLEKNIFNVVVFVSVVLIFVLLSFFAAEFSSVFYILICGCLGVLVSVVGKIIKGGKVK